MAVLNQVPVTVLPEGWSGPVFVEVVAAVERDWYEVDRGRVKGTFPALRVSTFTDSARESGEGVKYRGRVYHVDKVMIFAGDVGGFAEGWSHDSRDYYAKGLLGGSGSQLDWKSPMRTRLYALMETVRDAFVADHPGWARESLAMRLEWQIKRAEDQAAGMRREALEYDAQAEKLRAELAAL